MLADECRQEDELVWLIACLYVHPAHRSDGLVSALVKAAMTLAADQGALAVQAWPLALGRRDSALAHVGGEAMFLRLGFERTRQFDDGRVLMRRELRDVHSLPDGRLTGDLPC
jgi:GNAT superfamily N-acetyltransferase